MIVYNSIGKDYSIHRKADQRIVEKIHNLLDVPKDGIIAEIGAGSGNYSNAIGEKGNVVFAIEPSSTMIFQAIPHPKVTWMQSKAEYIPLMNDSVDGIFIILAIHHFQSLAAASVECSRICKSGSMVIFTWDPRLSATFWFNDYFPSIDKHIHSLFNPIESIAKTIASNHWTYDILPFPLPNDLTDKFMSCGWNKPEMYLDSSIRNSMSGFVLADQCVIDKSIEKLKKDLKSGVWDDRYGFMRSKNELDLGYRFIRFRKKPPQESNY